MIFLGIDPGVSGGIAMLDDTGFCLRAFGMPDTERDLWESVRDMGDRRAVALVEQLGGMPRDKDGKARQSPTTMTTMGRNYGSLRMALVAAGIPFDEVLPRKWQAEFGLLSRPGESKTAKADMTVCAWGADGKFRNRAREVEKLLQGPLYCLGLTKHGAPKHPLYLRSDTMLELYRP